MPNARTRTGRKSEDNPEISMSAEVKEGRTSVHHHKDVEDEQLKKTALGFGKKEITDELKDKCWQRSENRCRQCDRKWRQDRLEVRKPQEGDGKKNTAA